MLVLDQVITQKEIDSFKQFFQDYQSKKYINYQIGDQVITDINENINDYKK